MPPSLPLGRFDIAICSEVIEHVNNPQILLRHAATLTLPDTGMLILTTQSGFVHETEKRVGHRRHFLTDDMVDLLSAALGGDLCEFGTPVFRSMTYQKDLPTEIPIRR